MTLKYDSNIVWSHSLVQILVIVANTQVWNLRVEVDKGFMWTVIVHELVGPKAMVKLLTKWYEFDHW